MINKDKDCHYVTCRDEKSLGLHRRKFDREWYLLFVKFAVKYRTVVRSTTLKAYQTCFWKFMRFAESENISVSNVESFHFYIFINYLDRLDLDDSTKNSTYVNVAKVLNTVVTYKEYSFLKLITIPPNPFGFDRSQNCVTGLYTDSQIELLQSAIKSDINKFKLESFLEPPDLFWKNKPEPIKRKSKWANVTYCIWYWETQLDCGNAIPNNKFKDRVFQRFWAGIRNSSKFENVADFKKRIGANSDSYTRRFEKREPAILRRVRLSEIGHWVTINHVKWYVLNVIIPEFESGRIEKKFHNRHNKFFQRAIKFFGLNNHDCFALVGIPWNFTCRKFAPLLIALHLETGFNLQPVLDLRRNCLNPRQDLNKANDYVLHSYKNRSDTPVRRNIPSGSNVISIIKILENIRNRIDGFFPHVPIKSPDHLLMSYYRAEYVHPDRQNISKAYKNFKRSHKLDFPVTTRWARNTHLNGLLIKSNGNLFAVKQAAGHSQFTTTVDYARNVLAHKDFKKKIGEEVSFMADEFERRNTTEDRVQALVEGIGCSEEEAIKMLQKRDFPMMFFKCANPFDPPGSDSEVICHHFHSIYKCLECKSLVFVEEDLYDYYSMVNWRSVGHDATAHPNEIFDPISQPLFESVEEKLEAKFPKETLHRYKQLAQDNPLHGRKN